MNAELLKYTIARKKKTQNELSKALGFSRQSLQNRLSGEVDFKIDEVRKIQEVLELTSSEVIDIFFSQ